MSKWHIKFDRVQTCMFKQLSTRLNVVYIPFVNKDIPVIEKVQQGSLTEQLC